MIRFTVLLIILVIQNAAAARAQPNVFPGPGPFPPGLLLNLSNTWTGTNTFSGSGTALSVTNSASVGGNLFLTGTEFLGSLGGLGSIHLASASGQLGFIDFVKPTGGVWNFGAYSDPQSGNNSGASLYATAYADNGSYTGTLFQATRVSGPFGLGAPYFSTLAPFNMTVPVATAPGGVIGSTVNFGNLSDVQPTAILSNNPLSTSNGSTSVTINWPGCCGIGGPISVTGNSTWVNLSGASAVGGITPTGWLSATSIVDSNNFTVAWSAPAASTATGGGSSISITPSFPTIANKFFSTVTTGSGGFSLQDEHIFVANPSYLPLVGSSQLASFSQYYNEVYSPNDTSKSHQFGTSMWEADFVNRSGDEGYGPNLSAVARPTTGLFFGPLTQVGSYAAGGGQVFNWNTVYSCFTASGLVAVYDCNSVQPNALVGASVDPTGHGGVGFDFFGAYEQLQPNPFSTTSGSSVITVTAKGGTQSQANGASIYIPSNYTINGVSFGGGGYVISNVNTSTGTFNITGTGLAVATGSGGGSGQWASFAALVPFAPTQFWGEWKHGIITTNAKFDSGGIIETQPGNGILWNDGTATASITGTEVSAGNINVTLTPAGTGLVKASGPMALTPSTPASSSVACTQGQIAVDSNYIYACTATNTWKRAALTAF